MADAKDQKQVVVVKKELTDKEKAKKKKNQKRIIIGGVVVVILAVIILPKLFAPPVLPTVTVTAPRMGNVEEKLDTSGTMKSENEKTYFSPVSAKIETSQVEVGQSVASGTQLITFNTEDLENQSKQAQLQKDASQYGYEDSLNKANEGASKFSSSSANVSSLEGAVASKQQEIINLQAAIDSENAAVSQQVSQEQQDISNQLGEVQKLSSYLSRAVALQAQKDQGIEIDENEMQELNNNILAYGNYYSDESKYNIYLIELGNQQIDLQNRLNSLQTQTSNSNVAEYSRRIQEAQNELGRLQTSLSEQQQIKGASENADLSEEQKAQLEANNNLAELQALSAQELLEKGMNGLQAEFDGIISKSLVVAGATVTQGMELFTISSSEDVYVDVSVSKYDFEKLQIGQTAEVDIAGNKYEATVESINKIATVNEKGVPVIGAKVKINNPDENIYLGVEAKVSILVASANETLLVPVEVINTSKDGTFCYVVEDDKVVKKEVETGVASSDFIEIKSGIKQGDTVLNSVTEDIVEGMKVQPVEEENQSNSDQPAS